ncbi:MAG: alpha/beta hydrolase [Saprospiraceae bacterium]|jgi:esterase/lipase|nr:alpha/beta hydrolase [Saprospiraceae bacterium]
MKPNLILLHGALGSENQFSQLKNLLSESFSVFAFNFEGHGGRASTSDYSMELFSQNVQGFMTENGIKSSHFFGYSMGGYVALVLARNHPESVQKIMTLGTKFDWTPESAAKEVKMLNPEKIEEKVPKFADMLQKRHKPLDWKEVLQNTAQMMLDLGNGKALKLEDFDCISHEVLIGLGSKDNMVTLEESQLITDQLSNGKLKTFEGFPHPVEQVDFQKLSDQIERFFL